MKKIMILTLAVVTMFAANGYAGTALATGTTLTAGAGEVINGASTTGATSGGAVLGRLSKGVQLGVAYDPAAYSLATKHLTGSKMYGTAFNSTSIYSTDSASGTAVTAPSSSDAATAFGSGWTSM